MRIDIAGFAVRNWQFTLVAFGLMTMLGVSALLTTPRSEDPHFPIPIITVRAILPGAGYCLFAPVRLCLGAVAGLRIIEAESSGSFVFQTKTSRVAPFVFGPSAQLAFIPGAFHVALDLSLLVTPEPPTFKVTGLPTTLPFPLLEGLFRLSVGWGTAP